MKRVSAFVLAASLAFCTPVLASDTDVTGLSFTELSELKQRVDAEYNSRPEAEPFDVAPGYYTVGQDINPGRYYVAAVVPNANGYSTYMHVYLDKNQFDSRPPLQYGEFLSADFFKLGDDPKSISFEEGNYLWVEGSLILSSNEFQPSDYSNYEVPEGTYVPAGVYTVGEGEDKDIPTGTYTVYAGTINGGDLKIYYSQDTFADDGSGHHGYDKHYEIDPYDSLSSEMIVLEEGYVLLVENDIVMKKGSSGAKLEFD